MEQTVLAVYENGVLRPLEPLELPEHSTVQVRVQTTDADPRVEAQNYRQRVRAVLREAGLLVEYPALSTEHEPLSEQEREELAKSLPADLRLSDAIIEEREYR